MFNRCRCGNCLDVLEQPGTPPLSRPARRARHGMKVNRGVLPHIDAARHDMVAALRALTLAGREALRNTPLTFGDERSGPVPS
jgi:hypothetical protein